MGFIYPVKPSVSVQSHVIETLKLALPEHSLLMEFHILKTDWEHISQCRVFVGSRIYHFIIRRGFMTLRNSHKPI